MQMIQPQTESVWVSPSASVQAVSDFLNTCKQNNLGFHSFVCYDQNECLVQVNLPPYSLSDKRQLYSVSKSFTSAAIGIAVGEGLLSIEDNVVDLFPEQRPAVINHNLAQMKVKHLLSMNTGHDQCTMPLIAAAQDGVSAFLNAPVTHKPGTHFTYNTGASFMLSAIVQQKAGMSLFDYLNQKLLAPLGIENARWDEHQSGICQGGIGLHLSCHDILKFGLLLLQKGVWEGQQLLPAEWVETATRPWSDNSGNGTPDWSSGYGFQFWVNAKEGFRADGAFGQLCMVFPQHNMVFAGTAYVDQMQKQVDAVYQLIEQIKAPCTLPIETLNKQAATFHLPLGGNDGSFAHQGALYRCDLNAFGMTFVSFDFSDNAFHMNFSDGCRSQTIRCGNGSFLVNRIFATNFMPTLTAMTVHDQPKECLFAASACFANQQLQIQLRYLNTPHVQTLICHFDGTLLTIENHDKERSILPHASKLTATKQ